MNTWQSEDTKNNPAPENWYCPFCKRIRNNDFPDGRDTILGVQHGDTLIIKHKDLRVEIEAEGKVGVNCRNCGAFVQVTSQDWTEVQKFKDRLNKERAKGGPPVRETHTMGYTICEG